MLVYALWSSVALADIAPTPAVGQRFLTHSVRVTGLTEHPGFVLVAHDAGDTVGTVLAWTGDEVQQLGNGASNRGPRLSHPSFRLMSREAYDAWKTASSAEVSAQREACMRGEGCAHISRFVPKITPPTGTVDCATSIDVVTSGPADGPDAVVEPLTVVEASATSCVLKRGETERTLKGAAFTGGGGCDTTGGVLSLVGALVAAGLFRRRRQ
ncbi:MAG: hypothetical protein H6738_25015 [Alphaproteobacteria bacterium]|nr:hypothetical protein [Alphaproteobacteria bacterium]